MTAQRLPLPMEGTTAESPPAPPAEVEPLPEPLTDEQIRDLKDRLIQELCTIFDPEIPVNIYELGLIYDLTIAPTGSVHVRMTLTTPMCPAAGSLPGEVEAKVRRVKPVTAAKVELIWDPPWDKNRMSEAAKLQLGIDD